MIVINGIQSTYLYHIVEQQRQDEILMMDVYIDEDIHCICRKLFYHKKMKYSTLLSTYYQTEAQFVITQLGFV